MKKINLHLMSLLVAIISLLPQSKTNQLSLLVINLYPLF